MLVLLFATAPGGLPTYSAQLVARSDYFIPSEAVRVQMDQLFDGAKKRSLVKTGVEGAAWTLACREDLGFVLYYWNHTGETPCLAVPTQACFHQFSVPQHGAWAAQTGQFRGQPSVQLSWRVDPAAGAAVPYATETTLSYTLDFATGAMLSFSNPGSDGIFSFETLDYWQFANATTPPDSSFDLPSSCATAMRDAKRDAERDAAPSITTLHATGHSTRDALGLPRRVWPTRAVRSPHLRPYTWDRSAAPPASVDNRLLAPAARDQGVCGGCWAFSAAAVAQVVWAKAKARANPRAGVEAGGGYSSWLSPQYLIDCAPRSQGKFENQTVICNNGCFGSACVDQPGELIVSQGIATEATYPYTAVPGASCAAEKATLEWPLSETQAIAPGDEAAMAAAVAEHGAVRAVMMVTPALEFLGATPGSPIFDDASCVPQPNHAVAIVGYGTEGGQDYWWVKNSFGTAWGQAGFFRLARGKNRCGIGSWSTVYVANTTSASAAV